jgi:hypothetical protein
VGGTTVLTANHVANGKEHRVLCDDGKYRVDPNKTVLSGTNDVDLGVLQLATQDLPDLGRVPFARVDRGGTIIKGFTAVGFPDWTVDREDREYQAKQVMGTVLPADRVRMNQPGGADAQPLRLTIRWEAGDLRAPEPGGPDDPWGGMSGAAVAVGRFVIGVVRAHNADDPNVLSVTPVYALTRLPAPKQQEFCDALGIADINRLAIITDRDISQWSGSTGTDEPVQPTRPTSSAPAFSDVIRNVYQEKLDAFNLRVPAWDCASLEQFYRECEERVSHQRGDTQLQRGRDLVKALWLAAAALPVLAQFDARRIDITKLQYLYHRHVHTRPESRKLDVMLIDAAGVGINEDYEAALGRGHPGDDTVTALARFMLGIASCWKARQDPATVVDLSEMTDWMFRHLELPALDIARYFDGIRRRSLAVIEFDTHDLSTNSGGSAARDMPRAIVIQTVDDARVETERIPCSPSSQRDVETKLRECLGPRLASGGNFIVDIFLPLPWLDAGLERLEPLSSLDPHLRWDMERHDDDLAARLRDRFRHMRWEEVPEDIPHDVTCDPERLREWIEDRELPGVKDPPFFIGSSHGAAMNHNPLAGLLKKGFGFIAWFTGEATADVRETAAQTVNGPDLKDAWDRKDKLPRYLAASLRRHKPIIIWSEPDRREDFLIPKTELHKNPRRSVRNRI